MNSSSKVSTLNRSPKILVIDGMNFMHRARSGFTQGDYAVVFNFFRGLRALVEKQQPTQIHFVIEGTPRARFKMMESYKANRIVDPQTEPEKHEALVQFHRQKCTIIGFLKSFFPISVIRHPDHECDDVIFNLINRGSTAIPWTVVSNDTDFIQLLQQFDHVTLYNPMKKENMVAPEYDYVTWKALRGDGSDNIPGVPGIGDTTAAQLASDPDLLSERLHKEPKMAEIFLRNMELINFITWDDEEALAMRTWQHEGPIWDQLKIGFDSMGFKSMTNDKAFKKFTDTFDPMWVNSCKEDPRGEEE